MDWTSAVTHLAKADPRLAPLIEMHGHPTIKPGRDLVRSLVRAIVGQQLSTKAADAIFGRFLAIYGGKRFPTAAVILATPDDKLRTAGLSGAKAASVKDVARHVVEKRIAPAKIPRMNDEQISAALLPIRGIGPWSVDMFLMFTLARPDVLPVGDYAVRKGMQKHFRLRSLPDAKKMSKLAAPWAPYRSIGSWYMWRLLESG